MCITYVAINARIKPAQHIFLHSNGFPVAGPVIVLHRQAEGIGVNRIARYLNAREIPYRNLAIFWSFPGPYAPHTRGS